MKTFFSAILLLSLIHLISFEGTAKGAQPLTANHQSANGFGNIPSSYLSQVRSTFDIYYGHTSHGSQIITGLTMLENENSTIFAMPTIYDDYRIDLGNSSWESDTRKHLKNYPKTNLVMWSWCGQLSWYSDSQVNDYLTRMAGLEKDFPGVTFVYMTGHLDGDGPSGTLYTNNNRIRKYCTTNNKVLYDFADIESYNPDGAYYPDGSDSCEWCTTWCASHACPSYGCDVDFSCAHSHCFNCYRKGKAFWWLLARLAGWNSSVGRAELIGTWTNGIFYRNMETDTWTKMFSTVPPGPIAAGDVTGDGRADLVSCWGSQGIWYQNGATLDWTKVWGLAPDKVACGDVTGDSRAEIIGTWNSGIFYYNPATANWTKMFSRTPPGPIAAGDVTDDGKADLVSCWGSQGIWYQNGSTLGWTKVWGLAPGKVACGDVTGDSRAEIIGTWNSGAGSSGIFYRNLATNTWTKMFSNIPPGPIAAGDVTGDGRADLVSCWGTQGVWYQNGSTLGWTKVWGLAPDKVACGDVTGN